MRALQITELGGPDALQVADVPEPEPTHMLTPGEGVVVDVVRRPCRSRTSCRAAGCTSTSPTCRSCPAPRWPAPCARRPTARGSRRATASRRSPRSGGMAEVAVAPAFMTFALPEPLDFAQGAALILNYHTAYFALKLRGRLEEGERVLVHGAAGGVGTAALQVAKGLGASTVAVVSSDEKEQVARDGRRGRRRALRRAVARAGRGAHRRRRGRRARPRGRRPLHRQPALAARGRPRRGGRLHRRIDPGGEGEPAAAAQHRGGRRRLGRVRDGQARAQPARSARSSIG